ncbi:MAG: hybrid sensor histidine kinase/response regulator, partial [Mediterranea sp.]|nr:hybrid sensor histidine kinase/response regulator [Mediterranea sp.]
MKAQIRIYTLSLALCFVGVLQAQTGKFYSTSNGLSSTLINQIYQDNRGFIWTATEYGLNKFDGLRFSIYKYQPGDSTSLKNNYVRTLYEDNRGHLLVGCIDGLMRYNPETDTFHEVPMYRTGKRVYPHVTQMRRLRDGELWIVTSGQGIFKLDEQTGRATSIDILMQQIHNNFLSNLYEDSFNNVWIGSNGGLFCYQPATGKVRVYKVPLIRDNYILSILEDKQGNLFVGLEKHGLCRYDRLADRFVTIPSDDDAGDISVYTLALVNDRLLVGTDGQGMKTYNYQTGMLQDYLLNEAPVDFTQGKIHVILEDRDKNLWLGLFQKGIALLPKKETPFGYYGAKSLHYNPIGQGCVMSVYQDSRRHLWVGADSEGLYELNANGQRLRHYRPEQGENSVPGTILCMYEDSQDNFWLGSYTRGLGRLNRTTGLCDYPLPINNERIYSITEDRDKNLYIATLGSGFYRYNLLTRELTHYESAKDESGDLTRNALSNDYINHVFCDSDGLIWLAHYKGISCFNPMTESFINYNGVNTLIVDHVAYVLQEDYAGNIWAGTTDGLYRFDKQNNVLTRYSTAEGLPNNVICGICEDHGHNLWVSTYMGISKYDRAGRRFVNYYAGDGLQGNEFTHGAYFIDSSGMVYFGGTEGITLFRPEAIKATSKEAPVLITDFFIFDRPVRRDTRSGGEPVVYQSVPDADYFQLAHGDNTFSIVFSNLQYDNPEQTTYQYRIDELAARWITTEPGVNSVTYNNLLPGKYTFHVRAVSHGNYSPTRTVKIIIAPPWYEMWWAYVIYIALIVLLIAGVVNNILSRMRHKREILEREHAEQLGEAKLQFFINISHEIRTPMTLIINPLEKLIAQTPEGELQKTYLMIYRNAQRILRLINQLMDIRKLDKGQMQMTFRETDMVGFIDDIVLTFNYPATKKQIALTFVHAMPQLSVWIDLNNFDKILMNILSNALKYTPEKGDITIALTTGHDDDRTDALRDYCEISVTDSGIGIEKERIERIFERFYQIDNDVTQSNFGTGIGLHLSRSLVELHHGTLFAENREDASGSRFVIRIPLGVAHLNTDELGNASTPVVHHPA